MLVPSSRRPGLSQQIGRPATLIRKQIPLLQGMHGVWFPYERTVLNSKYRNSGRLFCDGREIASSLNSLVSGLEIFGLNHGTATCA